MHKKDLFQFILATYAILLIQILLTFMILWHARSCKFAPKLCTMGMRIASLLLCIALIFCIFFFRKTIGVYGQFVLLLLFTFTLATSIQCFTGRFPWKDIQRILWATAFVFVLMSIFGYFTLWMNWDLGWMTGIMIGCLVGLIVGGILLAIFPTSETTKKIFFILGVLLFSIYVVFDTNQMITRYATNTALTSVESALDFFLDFINIFLNLLSLSSD